MITETNPHGAGRPPAEIDWNLFEECLKVAATEEEVCRLFNVSIVTLLKHIKIKYGEDSNFLKLYARYGGHRNISIRRMRFNHAKKNWNACQELCARFLNEHPLINKDPDQKVQDMASLLKMVLEGKITQTNDVDNV